MPMFKNILTILLILFFSGCNSGHDKTNIGFVGTLTGKYSDLGQESLKGVLLAIDKSGMSDSINLVTKDDMGSSLEWMNSVKDLHSNNVRYIIGPNLSSVTSAVIPFIQKRNIYMISPTASASSLADKNDNLMRVIPPNSMHQMTNIAKYLTQKMKIRNIVIIYDADNIAYTNDVVKSFANAFMSKGGQIRDMRSFNGENGKSMSSLIENDIKNPPQMYYIVASAADTAMILWQIKKNKMKTSILVRSWAISNDFYRFSGEASDGVYFFNYDTNSSTKEYKQFYKDFMHKYKKPPTWISLNGYTSGVLLIKSLKGLNNGESFYDAVNASSKYIKGLSGLTFDENGDAYLPMSLYKIHNGKATRIGLAE